MSTDTTWRIATDSSDATERLGASIGARLRGGEVLELTSDLGGGKTTLVRGLARGAGSSDAVGSPSFTISRVYRARRAKEPVSHLQRIVHYDFYRLSEPGLMAAELAETLDDPGAVVVVEWADSVRHVLPDTHAVITITATGENTRDFKISLPESYGYLRAGT